MGLEYSSIPPFRTDGYLPEGLHRASVEEVTFRFGASTPRRRRLALRLRRWMELGRQVGGQRLLLDPSSSLPADFEQQVAQGIEAALELEDMLLTRRPEEIFAAEDQADWDEWTEFFSRTRETDGRRKGLVEVEL